MGKAILKILTNYVNNDIIINILFVAMRTIIRIVSKNSRKTIVRRKNIMALKVATRLERGLGLQTKAKELRNESEKLLKQAQLNEEKAVESFRKAREEMLRDAQHKKEKLEEELNALKTEYFELASKFCKQQGHTETMRIERILNAPPLYHSFLEGDVYPKKIYYTCLVCGCSNDPEVLRREPYKEGSEKVIQKASEQNENLELKQTAQRILEVREQLKSFGDNSKDFEEICSLFGHEVDCNCIGHVAKCECCGKELEADEYYDAYRAAKYKGVFPYISSLNWDNWVCEF